MTREKCCLNYSFVYLLLNPSISFSTEIFTELVSDTDKTQTFVFPGLLSS